MYKVLSKVLNSHILPSEMWMSTYFTVAFQIFLDLLRIVSKLAINNSFLPLFLRLIEETQIYQAGVKCKHIWVIFHILTASPHS